jgi:putative ABC transport system permease protein
MRGARPRCAGQISRVLATALVLILQLRTVAVDERFAADYGLRVGDTLRLSAQPAVPGTTPVPSAAVVIGALVRRNADPAEVARSDYKLRLHLTQLQELVGYEDRVDRFAIATDSALADSAVASINRMAFGFRAHRSRDIAVGSSRTFAVVSRFNRAIGVITIVASAIFLLCIMLLKVDERRRDVAALRLIGISRATVMRAVVLEASLIAVLGSGIGVGLGYAASSIVNAHYRAVYRTPLAFSIVTPGLVLFAVGLSVVLGIGAGVLAARRLARTPPLTVFGR